MESQKVTINLKLGLHARPIAMIIRIAGDSELFISNDTNRASTKSMGMMLSLGVKNNDEILLEYQPNNKDKANKIIELLEQKED